MKKVISKIHIAPMMGWTNCHFRYLMKLICPDCVLYTEMITSSALLNGDRDKFLAYDKSEHPVVVQLGGNNPKDLAKCAKIVQERGFNQVNLNIGCPSSRVSSGGIGACLYKDVVRVKDCISAMCASADIDVTVKTRVGVDDIDSLEYLINFVASLQESGCSMVIVHARKAWLKGLNPRQNRTIPKLEYEKVKNLVLALPDFPVVINGGIKTLQDVKKHLEFFKAVMIGRTCYENSWILRDIFNYTGIKDNSVCLSKLEVFDKYMQYCNVKISQGVNLSVLLKPLQGFVYASSNAKSWRKIVTQPKKDLDFSKCYDQLRDIL